MLSWSNSHDDKHELEIVLNVGKILDGFHKTHRIKKSIIKDFV